ncbi:MAG: TolC family protein [Thermodesulfobacteriota bacterium]
MKMKWIIGWIIFTVFLGGAAWAQGSQAPLTLEESIRIAMERSLSIHSAVEGIAGSEFRRKQAFTNFLPLWTGQYGYTRANAPSSVGTSSDKSRDLYNFSTTASQPLFTGGSNLANYRSAKIGVDLSKEALETAKMDLVLQVRTGYFNILRAEKFLDVAQQQVKQFEAQLEVTKAFFDVGIVPKNDVLQAEVQLANARQGLVKAENDLAVAKSSFNILLRREINTPLEVVDILEYKAFPLEFEASLDEALRQRPEIKTAQFNVDQANENVKIARSEYFPTVNLIGGYNRSSEEVGLHGDIRSERWTAQVLATITLWNWGNTAYKVGENKVKVTQAEDSKTQIIESIILQVKQGYLNMLVAEKNVGVAKTAIEQAEENLRMNEERYKYQVATQTDVLNAVTLLTQARSNYFGALSDFNVAKAELERAMGRMNP